MKDSATHWSPQGNVHDGREEECRVPECYLPAEQPDPVPNDSGSIQQLVIADMAKREKVGIARYGTPLQVGNGRDMLRDAYEEALDLAVYLRGVIEERRLGTVIAPGEGPFFTAADLALYLKTGQPVVPSGQRFPLISPERAAWLRNQPLPPDTPAAGD